MRASTILTPLAAITTAWVLTATALVLLMRLPGLALFYDGLIRDGGAWQGLTNRATGSRKIGTRSRTDSSPGGTIATAGE